MSQSRAHPFPPPLPLDCSAEALKVYHTLQKHRHHPPILQDNSQTLAAPFKELSHHRTPSESIGNNYSPRAQGLKINKLQHIPISKSLAKPVGPSCSSNIKPRLLASIPSGRSQSITPSTRCRPMSPQEQLDILHREEETMRAMQTEPTERDLERYTYYIANGVPSSLLATQPLQQMMNIMRQLPPETEDSNIQVKIMRENMKEEVTRDYCFTLRKSIVDYILMDPSECQRLSICSIPKPFPRRVIRGPVPWHTSYRKVYTWQSQHLFTVSQIMILLQDIWLSSFSSLRFVGLEDLFSTGLPLLPSEFEEFVQRQCQTTRDELVQNWLPHCASIIDTSQALWLPLTHEGEQEALVIVKEFFSCVAALMSMQLRSLVVESLQDLLYIFTKHEDGNDFGEVFDEMKYIQSEVLQVELQVKEPHIDFSPSLQECWEFIHRGFMQIIKSAEKIPRLEFNLFLDITNLYIRTVSVDEPLVTNIINKAKDIFHKNVVGPKKYLSVYQKYSNLLDHTAIQEISSFLNDRQSLEGFRDKIESFNHLRQEIASLHVTVPLSMFCLHAGKLNDDLCGRAERLKDKIIMFEMKEHRELNEGICRKYEEITETIRSTPETTEELVSLNQYINITSNVTTRKLMDEIDEARFHLSFLLDYATLPPDDLKLNACVYHWPNNILTELEDSRIHLATMKEQAQDFLQNRVLEFNRRLKYLDKEIRAFEKKDVMNMEEIKTNVRNLTQITANLEAAVTEQESINNEQNLLEMEQRQYPLLQTLIDGKLPYERLWTTALNFQTMSEEWMNGPFLYLDAEKISDDLDMMWRTMLELTESFLDRLGPYRVAKIFKGKMEEFKQHLPILRTICNPAIRDRHWEAISDVVGFAVKSDASRSLLDMLDLGLSIFSDKLEEIGASASNEDSLEKSMEKMMSEWAELRLSFIPHGDTGTHILSEVDDIQVLLDEHVIKTQTMRSSPFIKPIETDCKHWEEKLLSMQAILDSMLKCQAAWLRLEPIFSSEDIVAQMPEEGRKFAVVDSYWKHVIATAVKDTHVLVATGQPNMLQRLQESNVFLDDIQKGLHTYQEKERL